MTKSEANLQIEDFFSKLGLSDSSFAEKNFVSARIGEAMVSFEFDAADEILSAQALIYRFRRAPADKISDAIFAEETEANCGGGRVVFNSENFTFYLQKDFREQIGDDIFYKEINRLAKASLIWNTEIIGNAAEKTSAK